MPSKQPSAAERLQAYLTRHPDAVLTQSLREIGTRIGVSDEWVRKLLALSAHDRTRRARWRAQMRARPLLDLERRLQRFLTAHPEAVRRRTRGGLTFKEIASRLRTTPDTLRDAWRSLRLPDRTSEVLAPQERSRRNYERDVEKRRQLKRSWIARHPERYREIQHEADRRYREKKRRERAHDGGHAPRPAGADRQPQARRRQPAKDQRRRT